MWELFGCSLSHCKWLRGLTVGSVFKSKWLNGKKTNTIVFSDPYSHIIAVFAHYREGIEKMGQIYARWYKYIPDNYLYFLYKATTFRSLWKFGMWLSSFYICIIEHHWVVWEQHRKRLQWEDIYNQRVHRRACSIIKDAIHPQHMFFHTCALWQEVQKREMQDWSTDPIHCSCCIQVASLTLPLSILALL